MSRPPSAVLSRPLLASLLAGVVASGLAACASTSSVRVPSAAPLPDLVVDRSEPAPALEGLLESFYGPGDKAPLALLTAQAAALEEKHPRAWEVHEVQAYLDRIRGDVRGAWWHFLSAAADLRARDARLYLKEATSSSRSRSEMLAEVEVLEALAGRHPDPTVRDAARVYLVEDLRRLGRLDEAETALPALPHLKEWQLLGALDNDQGKGFLTVYPPELGIDLDAAAPGHRVPIRWRAVERMGPTGEVPLYDLVSPASWSVAYLASWVHVDRDQEAELRITTADPLRAWVNEGLVVDQSQLREAAPDNVTVPVKLAKGWNKVLIKSAQERGGWSVRARLTRPGGAPIPGLTESREPHPTPVVEGGEPPDLAVFPYEPAPSATNRSLFLRERYLSNQGRYRDGLDAAQIFLDNAPGSRLGQMRVAVMLDVNQEAGRAIDLLNTVIDESEGEAGWFLRRRARFFRAKRQLDRAQTDLLRLLNKAPGLERVRMDLAHVFERRGFKIDRCQTLDEVLETYPDSAWVVREKADCLSDRGFEKQAYQQLEVAHALEPGHASTLARLLDRAVEVDDEEGVEEYSRRLLALRPTSVSTRLKLSFIARVAGDDERARQLAEEARALDPDDPRVHRRLGELAYEAGDKERALEHYETALACDPDDSRLANLIDFASTAGPGFLEELAPGAAEIEEAVARREEPMPPGTQVALLLDHEVTHIKSDGSARSLVTIVSMAVTKQGQDALIRSRIPTNRTKLLRAYSLTPEGVRQEASSIRGGTIRFRNPEVGTVTVVQYLTHRGQGAFLPNHFVSSWFFQGIHRYYRDSRWVVLAPPERTLNVQVNGPVAQETEERGDYVVRTFSAQKVPPLIPERHMPPAHDLLYRVDLSTVNDWDEYVRWERALLRNAFRSNADLEELALELTEGAEEPREKFDRLFHYVSQEIRYQQDYENTIAGVRPHSCPVVLERGYGDCKDKAVLLILLAEKVGLDVDFAILRTTGAGKVQKAVPNQQFNHAIVYVPAQEGIEEGFFTDPTTDGLDMGNLRADDQGATSLVLDPDSGAWAFHEIPFQAPEKERTHYEIDVDLAETSGAAATIKGQFRGSIASSARRALRDEESRQKLYQGLTGIFFAGATARSGSPDGDPEDIYRPLGLTIEADASPAVHIEEDGTRLDLPLLFPLARAAHRPVRRLPLRLGIHRQLEVAVDIDLEGREVKRRPEDFRVEHACFAFERKTEEHGAALRVLTTFEQRCHEVAPEDYPAFRQAAQQVISRGRDTVLLSN